MSGAPEMEADEICSRAYNDMETKLLVRFPPSIMDEAFPTPSPKSLSQRLTYIRSTGLICFSSIIHILCVGIWGIIRFKDQTIPSSF